MADLADYIEQDEMARLAGVWLCRLAQDEDVSEDVAAAAQAALDRVDELTTLLELG